MSDCAHQAPLSMEFSRQEFWSGLSCAPPEDLPNTGSNLRLLYYRHILYHWASSEAQPRASILHFFSLNLTKGHTAEKRQQWINTVGSTVDQTQAQLTARLVLLTQGSPTSGNKCLIIWGGADVILIEIKCTVNVMHLNHHKTIPHPRSREKLSSTKPVLGAKKAGDHSFNP